MQRLEKCSMDFHGIWHCRLLTVFAKIGQNNGHYMRTYWSRQLTSSMYIDYHMFVVLCKLVWCFLIFTICIFSRQMTVTGFVKRTCMYVPIPVAVLPKAWAFGQALAGIVGSNPTGGTNICLSWVFVCCQVEVCAMDWSLVQRSPVECVVCLSVISEPWKWGPGSTRAVAPLGEQRERERESVCVCVNFDVS
jgi:hypothetical protein